VYVEVSTDIYRAGNTLPGIWWNGIEQVVRATAELSRNKAAVRERALVTDSFEDLPVKYGNWAAKELARYQASGGSLYGVTWLDGNDFTIWLNPSLNLHGSLTPPMELQKTTLHEMAHALVAMGTNHDESFRKLYLRSYYHWLKLTGVKDDTAKEGWDLVKRYTQRRKATKHFTAESEADYTQRIIREVDLAVRMAQGEHGQLRGRLCEKYEWTMQELNHFPSALDMMPTRYNLPRVDEFSRLNLGA
jgi:hypothetical protein